MLIHDLTLEECVQLLQRNSLAHLGCAKDGQPCVVPIHYSFDATKYAVHVVSTVGQKVDWMRVNPRVCLAVDEVSDKNHRATEGLYGAYEEIGDREELSDPRGRLLELL